MIMKPNPYVGMEECVNDIIKHFDACKREREPETKIGIKDDRALFNVFRLAYTRLRHSKRERRHFIHYIIRNGLWCRIEGRRT
jgi:hypothetical protein